jgi:hypothetical protein
MATNAEIRVLLKQQVAASLQRDPHVVENTFLRLDGCALDIRIALSSTAILNDSFDEIVPLFQSRLTAPTSEWTNQHVSIKNLTKVCTSLGVNTHDVYGNRNDWSMFGLLLSGCFSGVGKCLYCAKNVDVIAWRQELRLAAQDSEKLMFAFTSCTGVPGETVNLAWMCPSCFTPMQRESMQSMNVRTCAAIHIQRLVRGFLVRGIYCAKWTMKKFLSARGFRSECMVERHRRAQYMFCDGLHRKARKYSVSRFRDMLDDWHGFAMIDPSLSYEMWDVAGRVLQALKSKVLHIEFPTFIADFFTQGRVTTDIIAEGHIVSVVMAYEKDAKRFVAKLVLKAQRRTEDEGDGKHCVNCFATNSRMKETTRRGTKICVPCGARYCSRLCQFMHWPAHKTECASK